MAFRGHYDHSLDAKNRLNVPTKFRAAFADGMVLSKYLDPCVTIWTPAGFEALEAHIDRLNPWSQERRDMTRFFDGQAFDAELDSAGRVTLPAALIGHAQIEKEVVVVGSRDHLEVWDRGKWQDHQRHLDAEIPGMAENLGATA